MLPWRALYVAAHAAQVNRTSSKVISVTYTKYCKNFDIVADEILKK